MPETSTCTHHWLLPSPDAEFITGVCIYCNAERRFRGWVSGDTLLGVPATEVRRRRQKEETS